MRFGLRQEFGPAVTFLASYMHSDKDIDFALPDPDLGQSFTLGRKEKADSVEGQLLFRSPKVKVVAGGGYFDIDSNETTAFAIEDPDFGFTDTTTGDSKIKHTNLYAYALHHAREEPDADAGRERRPVRRDRRVPGEHQHSPACRPIRRSRSSRLRFSGRRTSSTPRPG